MVGTSGVQKLDRLDSTSVWIACSIVVVRLACGIEWETVLWSDSNLMKIGKLNFTDFVCLI